MMKVLYTPVNNVLVLGPNCLIRLVLVFAKKLVIVEGIATSID